MNEQVVDFRIGDGLADDSWFHCPLGSAQLKWKVDDPFRLRVSFGWGGRVLFKEILFFLFPFLRFIFFY